MSRMWWITSWASLPANLLPLPCRWLAGLVQNRASLARMVENAKRLANPHSTENIVTDLANLIHL